MYLEKIAKTEQGLSPAELTAVVEESMAGKNWKKVLILPPDFSRFHSNAGFLTCEYVRLLEAQGCQVDIMPALGTHMPVSREQWEVMFPTIPYERMLVHNWRTDVVKLGEAPASLVAEVTDGLWNEPVTCEINRRVMDESYDQIISIGQVVPHEVIGMSNESKNLFVGVGGSEMINKSHMISATYGIEKVMGKDFSPVRKIFDYCLKEFLGDRPILFFLTVTTAVGNDITTHGVFVSRERKALESAIALAQEKNVIFLDRPMKKCVACLPADEFHSTWIGNKAVYRTRMAIADGGELLILAPGVHQFGEDPQADALIRKYGYHGTEATMKAFRENTDLQENMGVPAHLIHGASDGRFTITYAVKNITREEIENAGFESADYDEMCAKYHPETLKYGWNTMPDGEEIFFVPNPALGLWIDRTTFFD